MAALSNSKELSGSGSSGSNFSHKSHRPIEMEDEPPSISTLGYKDSYDEMMSTYILSNGVKINEHGPRDADDHDLELAKGTVHPEDLLVLEELGRGASAVVKRCISRSAASGGGPSEEYVVKCFNMYDANKRKMFREEFLLLLSMDCPSIVEFHGAFYDNRKRMCLILEMMDRGSLEDVIEHARELQKSTGSMYAIPENILAAMAFQVVHGLRYLTLKRLMHRDIKPPNLLVNSHGQMKITDFGISRRLGRDNNSKDAHIAPSEVEGGGYNARHLDRFEEEVDRPEPSWRQAAPDPNCEEVLHRDGRLVVASVLGVAATCCTASMAPRRDCPCSQRLRVRMISLCAAEQSPAAGCRPSPRPPQLPPRLL